MSVTERTREWWKSAVVYQIYPASFCDSNGDGIGDLPGITSKLDYIASLGATVIWVCPMFDSPQVDMGYDISNYEDVYAPYGTLQDMEHLIQEAHKRNLRVMLDLVINHTSDQHAWFKESISSKENPKRDWYVWKPAKYTASGERKPPNNWRSCFGQGSVWEWDEASQEYYLHVFTKEQPDLNWENPVTRKAIYESAIEFWLKRGVDGFRVDTVNMYSKPQDYPDAIVTDEGQECQPALDLYCNGPRMHEFLREINDVLTKYNAITVGELPCTPDPKKILKYVSAAERQLNMVFQFDIMEVGQGEVDRLDTIPKNFSLKQIKDAMDRTQGILRGTDAWTTAFMENHDQARAVSRFANDSPEFRVASAKMLAVMQACMSGTQYVYQGQEIGSVNLPKDTYPLENYLDIGSIMFIDAIKGRTSPEEQEAALDRAFTSLQYIARDHSRVPVPWNSTGKNAGFSQAAEDAGKPVADSWMKPHPLAKEINVASQVDDPNSVLAFWRKALKFRIDHPDLFVYGDYESIRLEDPSVIYFQKDPGAGQPKALVVLSFATSEQKWVPPSAEELGLPAGSAVKLEQVLSTHEGKGGENDLAPFEGRVYFVNKN